MGNCHFKTDFDAENITGKMLCNWMGDWWIDY